MPQDLIGSESTEVESAYSSRGCFHEWSAVGGEKDRFCCLFYGLIVEKYTLICAMEIQKIHSCLFRICFIYGTTNVSVSQSWISLLNCWPRTICRLIYQQTSGNQNTVHVTNGLIWKFSREWLLWTGCATGGSLRKKPQSPKWSTRRKTSYRCSVQGIFVGIIIKTSDASLKVTDLLFAFAFWKNKPGKLVS